MATNSGKEKDALRDILDKLETPAVRWALVCIGVVILVRLRLILFAAALPVMAYWHYSNRSEEPAAAAADAGEDESPMAAGQDNRDDDAFDNDFGGGPTHEKEVYDKEFWSSDGPQKGTRREGGDEMKKETNRGSWDDGGAGDDFPPAKAGSSNMDDILGSLGTSFGGSFGGGDDDFGLGKVGDFDFLGSRGDEDFLSGAMGGGFGKGKGKGKKGDKGEKGDKGPREANPKQLFVAGVGDMPEDEIRMFFEREGEVERLKVLTNEDGSSKGVCFVTYRDEEMAKQALSLHGTELNGKNITVRMANGGSKGKGEGKDGEKGFGKRDREPRMDFGPSERFGGAFGDDRGGERSSFDRPQGKGKGKGGRGRMDRGEMDDLLEEALAEQEGPVKTSDFDAAARRFLSELKNKDRADGTERCQEAIDNVIKFTSQKDRDSVRKWSAYVYTLLQKMDPQLSEELRERDKARRQEKGAGRDRPPREITRARDDDDRDRD